MTMQQIDLARAGLASIPTVLLLSMLAGCGLIKTGAEDGSIGESPSAAPGEPADKAAAPPSDQPPSYNDNLIDATVKQALIKKLGIAASAIGVQAADGHVTLTGFVETEAEKQDAIAAARGIEGVEQVEDQITVK